MSTVVEQNLRVAMRRETLEGLASYVLPPGYSASWYAPGDEHAWLAVQSRAERYLAIDMALYRAEFGGDAAPLSQRQLFIRDAAGAPIGTATAWFGDDRGGETVGRVHWVAIVPEQQGRGLARPMLGLVCRRLRDLGHTQGYLVTSTARVPAINLYRSFGFAPDIATSEDVAVWRALTPFLKRQP